MECCEISSLEAARAEQEPEAHPVSGLPSDAQPHSVWSTEGSPVCLRDVGAGRGRGEHSKSRAQPAQSQPTTSPLVVPATCQWERGSSTGRMFILPNLSQERKEETLKYVFPASVLGRVRAAQSSCMRPSPSCSKHTMEPAAFLGIHTPLFSIIP